MSRYSFQIYSSDSGEWGQSFGSPFPTKESDNLGELLDVAVARAKKNGLRYRIIDTAMTSETVWEWNGRGEPPPVPSVTSTASRPSRRFQPGRF